MALLSAAIETFVRSSWLLLSERLLRGVLSDEVPSSDSVGVDPDTVLPLALAVPFAAFSAKRFCLEAEGAIA